ncbi:dihydrolipoamide acetyltransferase family protein [Oricola nitratireducens]|uniref:dihydrolipoamide acetyltransferase family protein n=1 Tax=Oricola nitratireducens TaxID=2775868 RepID=UPI001867182A|nr:dihydrolipoamide acetyltransferase family protein [Oricola nitratireducens]
MGEHTIKLPDVGEGVAEAELVEWHVEVGDQVREDMVLAAVMTDKTTVEIPSPVDGEVAWLGAEIGDTVAVGSPLIRLKTASDDVQEAPAEAAQRNNPPTAPARNVKVVPEDTRSSEPATKHDEQGAAKGEAALRPPVSSKGASRPSANGAPRAAGEKPVASPAIRLRARESGIDLKQVAGTGPAGRITHEDLNAFLSVGQSTSAPMLARETSVSDIKVVGLRRRISEKMALAKSRIPHITYVEEVDIEALEDLRNALNQAKAGNRPKLTLLPFLMRAIVNAIAKQPGFNAVYDDEAGIIHQHGGVHIGIATQTPPGLMVPVVHHAEARDIWSCATELARVTEAARDGTATREDLSGSTITITSLGAMGGIVTTPVINHPEVAIIGVNKIMVRPVWNGTQFLPRKMMNLSSSFDHRVIDGWDAAVFVQRLKTLLENPAMIFVED